MPFGIEWDEVDSKYNWLAVDQDGLVYAYNNKPVYRSGEIWEYDGYQFDRVGFLVRECDDPTWTTMIAERPQTKEEQSVIAAVTTTMNEASKGHKHHKEMLLYAQDAAVHKEPWKLWEFSFNGDWKSLESHPRWDVSTDYRRKPQTVTITLPEDVAIDFTNLVIVSDAGKAVSVAIQEALNGKYDD